MTQDELKALDGVQTPHGKWWVPFVWTFNLLKEARNEGRITDDYLLKTLMDVSAICAKIQVLLLEIRLSYLAELSGLIHCDIKYALDKDNLEEKTTISS